MTNFKRTLVLTMLIGLTLPFASAQFFLGARGGINLASMNTNIAGSTNNSIMGIHGGVTTRLLLTKKLSIGGDALFSQFGNEASTNVKTGGTDVTTKEKLTISYLLVPIYVNYEIPFTPKQLVPYRTKESLVSAHLYGGGYFGYALGAKKSSTTTTIFDDGTPPTTTSIDAAEVLSTAYNPIDFGLMFGAGFSFRLDEAKKQRLYLDFRYFMGMSDFDKDATATATNKPLAISLGYSYKLTNRIYTNRKRF